MIEGGFAKYNSKLDFKYKTIPKLESNAKTNLKALWNYNQPLMTKQKNRIHFYEYNPGKSSESSEIL